MLTQRITGLPLTTLITLFVACNNQHGAAPMGASSVGPGGGAGAGAALGGSAAGTSSAGTGGSTAASAGRGGSDGAATAMPSAGAGGVSAPVTGDAGAGGGGAAGAAGAGAEMVAAGVKCEARPVMGEANLHFHHAHFNSPDPAKDIEFFAKFFNAKKIDFCKDAAGGATQAAASERGYLLFTKVDKPADMELNSELDHVGFMNANPTMELKRLMALDLTLWKADGDNVNGQCMDVLMGTACIGGIFFYAQTPGGARIEVSNSPGPSTSGFGHIHLKGPIDPFFMQVIPGLQMLSRETVHIDGVNITNALLGMFEPDAPVESKGKPLDHIAYSTGDLMAQYMRIQAAGVAIAEEISVKPEFGFKSFFVKSPQGVWVEIVEDTAFKP